MGKLHNLVLKLTKKKHVQSFEQNELASMGPGELKKKGRKK